MMATYEGWLNYETWNVWLWITNTESHYFAMREYCKDQIRAGKRATYKGLVEYCGLAQDSTFDEVQFLSKQLSYAELNKALSYEIEDLKRHDPSVAR
jgi:hypothetical protein